MNKWMLYTALAGVFSSYMLSSCSGAFLNTSSFFSSLPDADGSPTIPSDKFFYVQISDATFRGRQGDEVLDYVMYERESGPGYDCKISKDEQNTTEDLYCMFEALEGDLFFHDIEFEYNVPSGMCDYFTFQTHWHYNQASGTGPPKVFREMDKIAQTKYCLDSAVGEIDCKDCKDKEETGYTSQTCYEDNGFIYYLGVYREVSTCPSGDVCVTEKKELDIKTYLITELSDPEVDPLKLCYYNGTPSGENCCIGVYDLYDLDKTEAQKTQEHSWGGNIGVCTGGLGRSSWAEVSGDGFPKIDIRHAINGLRDNYKIESIFGVLGYKYKIKGEEQFSLDPRYSLVTANYWEGIEDQEDSPSFYKSTQITNDKYKHKAADPGYPYITWACLDKAQEVRHRIHLIIREWNTREEFMEFKGGGTGDPDVGGKDKVDEGDNCDYYEQDDDNIEFFYKEMRNSCNDMRDVDDWMTTGEDYPELHYQGGQ